jgi:hypothetical protein
MEKHYRKENDCLNCGTTLEGKFCHNCGQENLELKESFGHMMTHAISDYFHFDHKFFHTLKPLLFKPGYLTNEYMSGRRASYLHPVKMYIFISIVYFLLLFQNSQPVTVPADRQVANKGVQDTISAAMKKKIENDHSLIAAQKKAILNNTKVVTDYGFLKVTEDNKGEKAKRWGWFRPTTEDTSYIEYIANQNKLLENERSNFLTRQWNKKVFRYYDEYGPRSKEVFTDELKHNAPKMMFLLLPIVALILKVTFWRNKKFYVEHLIYTFHLHCFLFLFLGIIILIQLVLPASLHTVNEWIGLFATLYVIWYLYRSLRVFYHRSRFRTITKLIGMSFMYFAAFTFCICVLFFVTALL